jgi:hypothetical protein
MLLINNNLEYIGRRTFVIVWGWLTVLNCAAGIEEIPRILAVKFNILTENWKRSC